MRRWIGRRPLAKYVPLRRQTRKPAKKQIPSRTSIRDANTAHPHPQKVRLGSGPVPRLRWVHRTPETGDDNVKPNSGVVKRDQARDLRRAPSAAKDVPMTSAANSDARRPPERRPLRRLIQGQMRNQERSFGPKPWALRMTAKAKVPACADTSAGFVRLLRRYLAEAIAGGCASIVSLCKQE
jgi:hypothetical protein